MKPKRSALPVVKLALEKALAQLVLARNAASLSGEGAIADTIAVATSSLDAIAKTVGTKTGNARLH